MTEPQQTAATRLAQLEWRWKAFADLTAAEVYAMLARAQRGVRRRAELPVWRYRRARFRRVASVCVYGPGEKQPPLAGYLRVLLPDAEDTDIRIGRVLTTAEFRGIGLGNAMLERSLAHIRAQWPGTPIRLHAQAHLQGFYGAFGFTPVSEIHEEDGIPHVWMRSA